MSTALSNEHYRILFNNSSDAIFVLSLGTLENPSIILEANDTACRRLGYSRGELIGHPPGIFNLPGHPKNMAEVMRLIAQEGHVMFETIHVCKDGRHIPAEVNLRTFELEGQIRVFSIARDITERKQLEDEIQRNQRNSQALLNAAAESAILIDDNFRILASNEIAAKRLGHSVTEIIGKIDTDILPLELALSRREKIEDAKRNRSSITFEDMRGGRRFQVKINPVNDENNEIHRFAIYGLDVTEQRQTEAIERLLTLISQKTLEGAPIQELFELICRKTSEDFSLALAWIGKKMDDGSIQLQAEGGSAQEYIANLIKVGVRWDDSPLGRGPTGTCVRTGTQQARHLDDVRFSPWKHAAAKAGLKSALAVPLILRGNIYGAFNLYSTIETQFDSPAFQSRINLLASKICLALDMAIEQEQVTLLSTAVTSARNAVMITNASGVIQWVNPAFTELSGYSTSELIGRQPSILKSGHHDGDYYKQLWQTILAGNVWSADAHEKRKDGRIYTVQQTITPIINDSGEITHFVAVHEDVTAKLETQKRIQHMASHDALTGLPNRSLFYDRLGNLLSLAKRAQKEIALLFIDLDGFKQVNDSQGHHVGDLLLQAVAQRLLECVRVSDTVARIGGDEFVVILYDVEGQEGAARVAEKIIADIASPFQLENLEVNIGASLGIAISQADEQEDHLTRRADAAMYQAKHAGKNTFRIAPDEIA